MSNNNDGKIPMVNPDPADVLTTDEEVREGKVDFTKKGQATAADSIMEGSGTSPDAGTTSKSKSSK